MASTNNGFVWEDMPCANCGTSTDNYDVCDKCKAATLAAFIGERESALSGCKVTVQPDPTLYDTLRESVATYRRTGYVCAYQYMKRCAKTVGMTVQQALDMTPRKEA